MPTKMMDEYLYEKPRQDTRDVEEFHLEKEEWCAGMNVAKKRCLELLNLSPV